MSNAQVLEPSAFTLSQTEHSAQCIQSTSLGYSLVYPSGQLFIISQNLHQHRAFSNLCTTNVLTCSIQKSYNCKLQLDRYTHIQQID